jgi:hypothetical protein
MKQIVVYQIILRKIGEDALLRPFLSNLFDPQHYIKNIIQQSKSEDCYDAIVNAIELINEEIKQYISRHKVRLYLSIYLSCI